MNNWSWLVYLLGVIAAVSIYVGFSRRILSWDPLTYWTKVDQVAALVRHGLSLQDVRHILRSASDEYSLLPAVLPGFLTSIAPDHTLIAYMLAVAIAYVVPASLATGALGYALANRLRSARRLEDAGDKLDMIVIGAVASFMVLPAFFLTYLSGVLLDIGGVFFCVVLTVSWVYFLISCWIGRHGRWVSHGIWTSSRPRCWSPGCRSSFSFFGVGTCSTRSETRSRLRSSSRRL